jgi:hypothetical protein
MVLFCFLLEPTGKDAKPGDKNAAPAKKKAGVSAVGH